MLLTVSLRPEKPAGRSSKRARHERVEPGSIVQGTVLDVHPLHIDVQLADGGSPKDTRLSRRILDHSKLSPRVGRALCEGTQRTAHLRQLLALDMQVRGHGSTSWRPTSPTARLLPRHIQ